MEEKPYIMETITHILGYIQSVMLAHILAKILKDLIVEYVRNKRSNNIYLQYKKNKLNIQKQKQMKNVNESYVAYGVIMLLVLFAALTSCASNKYAYHKSPARTGNFVCFNGYCIRK